MGFLNVNNKQPFHYGGHQKQNRSGTPIVVTRQNHRTTYLNIHYVPPKYEEVGPKDVGGSEMKSPVDEDIRIQREGSWYTGYTLEWGVQGDLRNQIFLRLFLLPTPQGGRFFPRR